MRHQASSSPEQLLASARSYRMLAKCYRYMGQWEHALPSLLDALGCLEEWRERAAAPVRAALRARLAPAPCSWSSTCTTCWLTRTACWTEQQETNISNPLRLSRALYHSYRADQLATPAALCRRGAGAGRGVRGQRWMRVWRLQVSLGCVYRLMGRQAQQEVRRRRVLAELSSPDTMQDERSGSNEPSDTETIAQLRGQRHDVLNLEWLSVSELEELVAEWFREAKAAIEWRHATAADVSCSPPAGCHLRRAAEAVQSKSRGLKHTSINFIGS